MITNEIAERRAALEERRKRDTASTVCFLRDYQVIRQEEGSSDLAYLFGRGADALEMMDWLMEPVRVAPTVFRFIDLYKRWLKTDDVDFFGFVEAEWFASVCETKWRERR